MRLLPFVGVNCFEIERIALGFGAAFFAGHADAHGSGSSGAGREHIQAKEHMNRLRGMRTAFGVGNWRSRLAVDHVTGIDLVPQSLTGKKLRRECDTRASRAGESRNREKRGQQ